MSEHSDNMRLAAEAVYDMLAFESTRGRVLYSCVRELFEWIRGGYSGSRLDFNVVIFECDEIGIKLVPILEENFHEGFPFEGEHVFRRGEDVYVSRDFMRRFPFLDVLSPAA